MKKLSLALCLCLLASACAPKSRSSEKKDTPAPKTTAPTDDPAKKNSTAGKTPTPSGGTATGSPQTQPQTGSSSGDAGAGADTAPRHLQLPDGTLAVTLPLQEWKSNEVKASNVKPGQNVGRSFKYVADADVTLKLNETSLYEIHSGCSSGETQIYMNTVTASGVKKALKGQAADIFLKRGQDAFVSVVIDNKGNCSDVNYAFAVLAIPAASASVSPSGAPGAAPVEKLVVKVSEFGTMTNAIDWCDNFACLARKLDPRRGARSLDPQDNNVQVTEFSYGFGGQALELRCIERRNWVVAHSTSRASCQVTYVPSLATDTVQIAMGDKTEPKAIQATITDKSVLARIAAALPLGYLNSEEKVELMSIEGKKAALYRLSLQCALNANSNPERFEKCTLLGFMD